MHLDAALHKASSLCVRSKLVNKLLHVLLFRRRRFVRSSLILGQLGPDIDKRVVVPLVVLKLLRQEMDDVGRHLDHVDVNSRGVS